MQSLFDLKDVNAKASRLDAAKLGWMNQQYLKGDEPADVAKHLEWHLQQAGCDLASGPKPGDVVIALRDRVQTLKDMAERAAVWYRPLTEYDEAAVAKHLTATADAPLRKSRELLAALDEWSAGSVSAALHAAAEALGLGMGKVAQPLRVAITGTQVSPDISHTVYLAGQAEAVKRIDAAIARIPA
jgi:glutamyl-tRNA synthetase